MIERTKARLEEARSLLRKLQDEKSRQVQQCTPTASPEFFARLNDFVTTARTITWVLQNEEREKYDAWSPSWEVAGNDKEVFDLVTKMRNSIEKHGRANIVARREQVEIPENTRPSGGSQWFGLPEWGRPTTDVYYIEHTDREVVLLCERYIEILTRMIGDFEQKHREP
jgi:hypothetical protein